MASDFTHRHASTALELEIELEITFLQEGAGFHAILLYIRS